jgi:cytoskeletal protein CcmA (bactofilin family)
MGKSLLFLTGGMVIIFGMIQFSVSERQKLVPVQTVQYYNELQAKNAASSIIELAVEQIRNDQSWVGELNYSDLLGASGYVTAYDQNSGTVPDSVNVGSWNEYKVLLYSEVEYEGVELTTEVLLQRDAFSKYSYFTDYEPSNIYFFSGDELSGPVHTNGTMNIAGDPTFYGMVTSPNAWRGMSGRTNNPQFLGGSNFTSGTRTPPSSYQLSQLRGAANSGGLTYSDPIYALFNDNGTVTIYENPGTASQTQSTIALSTFNGVISSSEKVYTKGVINGQVTLHSEDDIEIMGDITYSDDPINNPVSNDILGLVSEKNVIVDQNAHQDNGSQDLNIHASIMALDNSFTVEGYNYGGSKGVLNLLGGLIQQRRGPVGTFSGNAVASGFSKDYEYDERLLSMFPPSFPREQWFSVVYWRDRTN